MKKLFVGYKKHEELLKELDVIKYRYNLMKKENEDFKEYITDLVRQNKEIKEELSLTKLDLNVTKYKLEEEKRTTENLHEDNLNQQIKIANLSGYNKNLKEDNKKLSAYIYADETVEMAKKAIKHAKKYKTVRLRKKKLKEAELNYLEIFINKYFIDKYL